MKSRKLNINLYPWSISILIVDLVVIVNSISFQFILYILNIQEIFQLNLIVFYYQQIFMSKTNDINFISDHSFTKLQRFSKNVLFIFIYEKLTAYLNFFIIVSQRNRVVVFTLSDWARTVILLFNFLCIQYLKKLSSSV